MAGIGCTLPEQDFCDGRLAPGGLDRPESARNYGHFYGHRTVLDAWSPRRSDSAFQPRSAMPCTRTPRQASGIATRPVPLPDSSAALRPVSSATAAVRTLASREAKQPLPHEVELSFFALQRLAVDGHRQPAHHALTVDMPVVDIRRSWLCLLRLDRRQRHKVTKPSETHNHDRQEPTTDTKLGTELDTWRRRGGHFATKFLVKRGLLAERVGFDPRVSFPKHDFQSRKAGPCTSTEIRSPARQSVWSVPLPSRIDHHYRSRRLSLMVVKSSTHSGLISPPRPPRAFVCKWFADVGDLPPGPPGE